MISPFFFSFFFESVGWHEKSKLTTKMHGRGITCLSTKKSKGLSNWKGIAQNDFSFFPNRTHGQKLQLPSRKAHHWAWRAIALTPRCTILKRTSCKRDSAVNTLRGLPSGRLAPVQKTYW